MSSSGKTANLKMHSWAASDPVLRADFNENFNKIDSVIGEINSSYGSCEIYSGQYAGADAHSVTLTFGKPPQILFLETESQPAQLQHVVQIRDGASMRGPSGTHTISVKGNKVTFTSNTTFTDLSNLGRTYYYIAFAPAK